MRAALCSVVVVVLFLTEGCGSDSSLVPPDSGKAHDSSVVDGATLDGGVIDGSATDGEAIRDGSATDGEPIGDSSLFDSAVLDGSMFDGGTVDSAVADSAVADSAVADSATPDSAVPDASVDPLWALDTFCRTAIWPSCEWNARCGIVDPTALDACLRERIVECNHNVEKYHAAIAAGRLTIDEPRIKTCYAQMGSLTCSMSHLDTAECEAAFVGLASLGSVCSRADPAGRRNDCGEGYCRPTSACGGVCTPFAGNDQSCSAEAPCAWTSYCDSSTGTCKPRVGEGSPCSGAGPICAAGLVCLGTCVNAKLVGASCASPAECASQVCVNGTCGDGAGVPHCASGQRCPQGQVCWGDQCVTRGGQNAPCASSYFCQEGFHCASNQCIPLGNVNTPCTHDVTCQTHLFCNDATGRCAAMSNALGPCSPARGSGCRAGLYCDPSDARCKPRRADGEACTEHGQCRSSQCTSGGVCRTGALCE